MAGRIDAISTSARGRWSPPSSVKLAAQAARSCLEAAEVSAHEVGLILNAGVYRDANICEPAMGPFIQRRINANPSFPPVAAGGTFSFDVANGTCGVLTALQLVDGFLASGRVERGLVVTSDVCPRTSVSEGVSFEPSGGAILLSRGEPGGFRAFGSETFSEFAKLYGGALHYIGGERGALALRLRRNHKVVLEQAEKYVSVCVDCAEIAARRFLRAQGLRIEDVDLVIPSVAPHGFSVDFVRRLGLEDRFRPVPGAPNAYTAGMVVALERAVTSGDLDRARVALLVAVGAGITVSLALHEGSASACR